MFGVVYSFGEFFGPMADEFDSSRSATALFFAITTFAYFGAGVVTGPIGDRVGPRPLVVVGGSAMVVGLLLTAEVESIELGYVTYGVGVGLGVACCYVPMVAAVGGWFERQRTLALGLAVSGIGTGTLVVVPIVERLIASHGWRDTYRILAIVTLVLLALAALGAARPPVPAAEALPVRDTIAGRSDFRRLYASVLFISVALFTPFVFLADYVATTGTDGSAAILLGLIGMASIAGRLGLGAIAARLDVLGLYRLSLSVLAASFVLWIIAGTHYWLLVGFALVLGVSYGGFIALAPAVVADRFGTAGMGGVLGTLYTAAGLAGLVGPPLMGHLIDGSGYAAAQWGALASGCAGAALLIGLRPVAGASVGQPDP